MAKGLSRARAVWRHALKNSFLPVLTVLGTNFGTLLTGSFVVETLFQVHMLIHHIISEGKATYDAVYRDPARAAGFVGQMTEETGLFLTALFRYETLTFHARKFRLLAGLILGDKARHRARCDGVRRCQIHLSRSASPGEIPVLRADYNLVRAG